MKFSMFVPASNNNKSDQANKNYGSKFTMSSQVNIRIGKEYLLNWTVIAVIICFVPVCDFYKFIVKKLNADFGRKTLSYKINKYRFLLSLDSFDQIRRTVTCLDYSLRKSRQRKNTTLRPTTPCFSNLSN